MILPDVNVLVYAYRADAPDHSTYRTWLEAAVDGPEPLGLAGVVASGYVRLVTHPRLFDPPTPLATALADIEALTRPRSVLRIEPGPRHWEVFAELCRATRAKGSAIPDAWLAAMAIEQGADIATADRGFARFPGVRWHDPGPT